MMAKPVAEVNYLQTLTRIFSSYIKAFNATIEEKFDHLLKICPNNMT